MKKLNVFLLITLALFCFSGTVYANCQIQYTGRAASMFGSAPRGNFATKKECLDYWESRPAFEQNNSECVGCEEQSSSQIQQGRRKSRFHDSNIRQKQLNKAGEFEANRQQMIEQEKKKEQQARTEFEQEKKEMLTRLKDGSGGGSLSLKSGGKTLMLKSGNAPATDRGEAKAIKDLRNSVYWALKAANASSNDSYEAARKYGEYSARAYAGGDIELPSVPDVPPPVSVDPQVRLYQFLIKEAKQTTSELKLIKTNLKRAKEEKKKSETKINIQRIKIEELKQNKSERKNEAYQKEQDTLTAAAMAALGEAIEEDREASKNLATLNEQKNKQEENLHTLRQGFDAAEKHPEHAENILKKLEGSKQ